MRTRKRVEPAVETSTSEEAGTSWDAQVFATQTAIVEAAKESASRGEQIIGDLIVSERMEVEVTFGEELFTPAPYHSFRVGPFWAKGFTRVGESRMQAISRLSAELETVANEQREQRYRQYKAAVRTMYGDKAADAMFGTKR